MSSNRFLKIVSDFIETHHLLDKKGSYLLGLSGGADSVALLMALHALGYRTEAVHCNFHLREEESDRDETFCRKLCDKMGIPFHFKNFDTRSYAKNHKVSIEMAARTLRYNYFEELRKQSKFDGICVGHHRNDSVETILINLVRGTGIHGLTGISPKKGNVVRPLLCVCRNDIEYYLHQINQVYVEDSSNFVDDVVRNQIRLNVLPLLKVINPSVIESIAKTSERLNDVSRVFEQAMKEKANRVEMFDGAISKISIQAIDSETLLFYLLNKYDFTSKQIEQIYRSLYAETGTMFCSKSHELLIDRGYLLVRSKWNEEGCQLTIPEIGSYSYSDNETFVLWEERVEADVNLKRGCKEICLDRDLITFPLTVRRAKLGDRYIPFGMQGSKLLSDCMTDNKMSLFEKRMQLVVTDAEERIIWMVNARPDQRFAVTSKTTKMLIISYTLKK